MPVRVHTSAGGGTSENLCLSIKNRINLICPGSLAYTVCPMPIEKEWVEVYIWDKVRCRIKVTTEKGEVADLLVQLEVNEAGWKAAVRYNFAHGKPHMDLLPKEGKKRKIWLEGRGLAEILTYAEIDIKSNWRRYLRECGYLEAE
jgi:hypothetical protein